MVLTKLLNLSQEIRPYSQVSHSKMWTEVLKRYYNHSYPVLRRCPSTRCHYSIKNPIERSKSPLFNSQRRLLSTASQLQQPAKTGQAKSVLSIGGTATKSPRARTIQSAATASATSAALGSPHHDLKSYIRYTNCNNVNQKSTVFRGTLYEYSVQHILMSHLKFKGVVRSGRAGDKGVDLLGNWKKLLALVQCKSSTVKTGARLFREMAGVYNIFVAGSKDEGKAVIIIASPASITSHGMREFLQLSIPIIYCKIDYTVPLYNFETSDYDLGSLADGSALQSILYNDEAAKLLAKHGLKISQQYTLDSSPPVVPSSVSSASVKTSIKASVSSA
ncbi:Rrg7p [Sugiyamaella lignohabitans]|uniref:Required for respiratory growth protein 7, mitochondrial n=1 Tax=Sugiyamaella lignohabitans TaxID=796027 RepID=A0A161HJ46_9ASCO|nr:Rrg7p [Sugiyamaella lignohabitans]ANB11348.1 Rrg7p [Sugiyamaella lignohabitans]